MKATGIVRKVDELGRVVLPIELRNKFDIKVKDPLKKYEPNCIFCGSTKNLITHNDKLICEKCAEKIGKKVAAEKEE